MAVYKRVEKTLKVGNKLLSFRTGDVALKANGSVIVRYGNTSVLATAVADTSKETKLDFLPLTIEFIEKYYAFARIPGGFNKREGRPPLSSVKKARFVDKAIRPFFPQDYLYNTQIVLNVLSQDGETDPAWLGVIAASLALQLSDIPFDGPVSSVSLSNYGKKILVGSSPESSFILKAAGQGEAFSTLELAAKEIKESRVLEAVEIAKDYIDKINNFQSHFSFQYGKEKFQYNRVKHSMFEKISHYFLKRNIKKVAKGFDGSVKNIFNLVNDYCKSHSLSSQKATYVKNNVLRDAITEFIVKNGKRIDGRTLGEIRDISLEVSAIPVVHGSALFRRGETQSLGVTTLGTTEDKLTVEGVNQSSKHFFLHYNFPSFSVGEISPMRHPGRRELGHGDLAESAMLPVLPSEEEFPNSIRVVSDILESYGSSSMASVCSASASLMDAGVPIKRHVAGISIGMINTKNDDHRLLTDISGFEDVISEMDLKVAGTKRGITAIQLDVKGKLVTKYVIKEALFKALKARIYIIDQMSKVISRPKRTLPANAPRCQIIKIKTDDIARLIGPKGREIKKISELTDSKISIEDSGQVTVFAASQPILKKTIELISELAYPLVRGDILTGVIVKTYDNKIILSLKNGHSYGYLAFDRTEGNIKSADEYDLGDTLKVRIENISNTGEILLVNIKNNKYLEENNG